MSLPLLVRSKIFWNYDGTLECCWGHGWWDNASVAKQDAYIRDCIKFGVNMVPHILLNEAAASPFTGEFMASGIDNRKVDLMVKYIERLKSHGIGSAIGLVDCPQISNPRYGFWNHLDRLAPFIEIAVKAFSPLADCFLLGCETCRGPLTIELVEEGIGLMQSNAFKTINGERVRIPCGTHEVYVGWKNGKPYMKRRLPRNADFIAIETCNHPFDGCNVSIADMCTEVSLIASNAGGRGVWVVESNEKEDDYARQQNRALAELPGVIGVGGVM